MQTLERQAASAGTDGVQLAGHPTFSIVVPNMYASERLRDFHRRLSTVMEGSVSPGRLSTLTMAAAMA